MLSQQSIPPIIVINQVMLFQQFKTSNFRDQPSDVIHTFKTTNFCDHTSDVIPTVNTTNYSDQPSDVIHTFKTTNFCDQTSDVIPTFMYSSSILKIKGLTLYIALLNKYTPHQLF